MKLKNYKVEEKVTIDYPKEYSEIDVQFELMSNLRKHGLDFRAEVKSPPRFGLRSARFDLVVFKDEIALVIIEVKKKDQGKATAQASYYQELTGLPVVVCGGMSGIDQTIRKTLEIIK